MIQVEQVERAVGGERLPCPPRACGQHAVEHVDPALDHLDKLLGDIDSATKDLESLPGPIPHPVAKRQFHH